VDLSLPGAWHATRADLQRVAVHVLARRRSDLVGKFGLRPSPGGVATPAAGPDHEVVRIAGGWLLRERTGQAAATTSLALPGSTLADAAELVEVDLSAALDVGHDTPPPGDADAPLQIDPEAVAGLARWFAVGQQALDRVVAELGAVASPSVAQLWPEHFDLACDVGAGGTRTNLGVSPGDADHPDPYLYVGPWADDRPGDASFWNAPFGGVLSAADLDAADPQAAAAAFYRRGVQLLAG
jgi:hypothetical protein